MEFKELVGLYERLRSTTKHLEKTYILSEFLSNLDENTLKLVSYLAQGRVFPHWDARELGISSRLLIKIISKASGKKPEAVEKQWASKGDLGLVSESLITGKNQQSLFKKKLSIQDVHSTLAKLPSLEGKGSVDQKSSLVLNLFLSASPKEAAYISRLIIGDLRIGIGDGILRDAISFAFLPKVAGSTSDPGTVLLCPTCEKIIPASSYCVNCKNEFDSKLAFSTESTKILPVIEVKNKEEFRKRLSELKNHIIFTEDKKEIPEAILRIIQDAFDISSDFGEISVTAKQRSLKGLKTITITPLRPVKLMLFPKAKDFEELFQRLKTPFAVEYKYDGFRVQIHKKDNVIRLFTRNLEDVTDQFPDIVSYAGKYINADSFLIDSEAVGISTKTGAFEPFQKISQRIKRKYDIDEIAENLPVEANLFDILYLNGEVVYTRPFRERRNLLEKVTKEQKGKIVLAKQLTVSSKEEAESFYKEALAKGNEGIMAKSIESRYRIGKRVGSGFKIKPVLETLDLVITGAEYGEGKRAGWLTSFFLSCMSEDGDLLEIGKVSSGLKELKEQGLSFIEVNELLKELITSEKGKLVSVKPSLVIEVAYDEIQKSPTYSSGYALRFPRIIRLREEKSVEDASSLGYIDRLYNSQRGRSGN
ncbi:MAG TPA: ATP-dependent DNA ligase [Candidatus Woesearchaeota archaeon]|nr:ATP-dependent DNA ligase [Candidatus Woesearchaeota archaeon]